MTFYDLLHDGYSARDYYESKKLDPASSKQQKSKTTTSDKSGDFFKDVTKGKVPFVSNPFVQLDFGF